MESSDNILNDYIKASQDYRQCVGEWDRFFSSTENKQGKVDFVILQEQIRSYRSEITNLLDGYINKRESIWDELLKTILYDKTINIKECLDQDTLEDFDSFVLSKFDQLDDEKVWSQFIHFIKWERSKLDLWWIHDNILSTAKDRSWTPVSLFQEDASGNQVFAPYITLHGRKYIFDTSYDSLNYISDKITLSWWGINLKLSDFTDISWFKIKSTNPQLLTTDGDDSIVPDMRTNLINSTFSDWSSGINKILSFQYNTLDKNLDDLCLFLWFDPYKVNMNKSRDILSNPIIHIKNNQDKRVFWNYIVVWFIALWYADKYYKLNKKQHAAMYILKTFYHDQFDDLHSIFENIVECNVAMPWSLQNKSNMLHNIIIFIFETILIKLIWDHTKYELYKTLPFDDINSGIDIIMNDKRSSYNDHSIQLIDLKSGWWFLKDKNKIGKKWVNVLWKDIVSFVKERFWHDILSIIKNDPREKCIIKVPLGSSIENYHQVEMYLKSILSLDKKNGDSTNYLNLRKYINTIEDKFDRHFSRSYFTHKKHNQYI